MIECHQGYVCTFIGKKTAKNSLGWKSKICSTERHDHLYHLYAPFEIIEKWGANLNSIGNLVVLEQSINRSINNRENQKLPNYKFKKTLFYFDRCNMMSTADWQLSHIFIPHYYPILHQKRDVRAIVIDVFKRESSREP